ncbi:MAG: helix-turn-helix domain-containing protein [Bacillota bacterium]
MEARDIRRELAADGFMSVHEAELFSGLKKSKLYALMAAGELPYARIGAARRIPKRALIEFLARNIVLRNAE